jgi:hypothetical protein
MSGMHYDYSKRNYLLPHGCKDLIDVLKLEKQQTELHASTLGSLSTIWKLPKQTEGAGTADFREVVISDKVSIIELAMIVGKKPFKIIADLLQLGDFVSMKEDVDFETAAKLLRKYGLVAKRPG